LWDASDGRQIGSLAGHVGDIRFVRFSPDGRLVLSASRDRTMRAWDVLTRRELHAFSWATDRTWSFDLSRDGQLALEGYEDGSISLWDFSYVARYRELETRAAAALASLRLRDDDVHALTTLGEWYAFRGVAGWASELLRRAERGGAKVSALMLGRSYWQQGDVPAAKREFARALANGEAPAEYLKLIIDRMGASSDRAGRLTQLSRKDGRVRYPFLGIRAMTAGAGHHGATVTRVFPDSPAAVAGLRAGDVIINADEQGIESDAQMGNYLASRSTGTPLTLTYVRGGQTDRAQLVLGDRPGRLEMPDGAQVREPRLGCLLQTLTPALAGSLGLDPALHGAVVTSMATDPPTEVVGRLLPEDVLVKVDGRPVTTAEQALAAIQGLPPDRFGLPPMDKLEVVRPGPPR
jgi:hypothetical protein